MESSGQREVITSRHNAWFRRFRRALEIHESEIVIEGPKQVRDAIRAGWSPLALAVPMDFDEPWDGLLVRFDARLIDALSPTVESQRILGLFERPSSTLDEILAEGTTLAIALDGVQDPGNVGTIIRLAAAFEASGVIILTGTADPFGPKAMRASSGTLPLVRVCAASAQELIAGVRDRDLDLFSTAAAGGASEPPPSGGVLVFGSEGKGVSPEVSEASKPLSIPISSRVDSLNVAAAAAILLARSFARRNAKETRR